MKNFVLITLIFSFFTSSVLSQNPEIERSEISSKVVKSVLQTPFNGGIKDILISPDGNHYVTAEGDITTIGGMTIKLWDYNSKIMISEHWIASYNGPGSGKMMLLNHGKVYLSLNQEIILLDLVNKTRNTVFNREWPEYILTFDKLGDNGLLISSKIYDENAETIDDISNNSKVYCYNTQKNMITDSLEFKSEVTCVKWFPELDVIAAGDNKGQVYFLDNSLNEKYKPISFYKNEAIRFIHIDTNNYVLVNAAIGEKKYFLKKGLGELKVQNMLTGLKEHLIKLKKEIAPENNSIFEFHPSNYVVDLILMNNNSLLINYGFSSIASIDLSNFNYIDVGPKKFKNEIGHIRANPISEELMFCFDAVTLMGGCNQLGIYDYKKKQVTYVFEKKDDVVLSEKRLYKIGNKHVWGYEKENVELYNSSCYSFIQPNFQDSVEVVCSGGKFTPDYLDGYWLLKFYKKMVVGKPKPTIFFTDSIFLEKNTDWEREETGAVIKGQKYLEDVEIFNIEQLEAQYRIVEAFFYFSTTHTAFLDLKNYKNDKRYLAIIDTTGKIIFKVEHDFNVKWSVSPNKKYLAIGQELDNLKHSTMHVIDLQDFKDVVNYKYVSNLQSMPQFSTDGNALYYQKGLMTTKDPDFIIYLVRQDLKNIKKLDTVHQDLFYLSYTVDEKRNILYLNGYDSRLIIDLNSEKIIKEFGSHNGSSNQVIFYPELDRILMMTNNCSVLLDPENYSFVSYYLFPKNQHALVSEDGYYMTPGFKPQQFGFKVQEKAYPFKQFDLHFNRPDTLLQLTNLSNSKELQLYTKARRKRLINLPDMPSDLNVFELMPSTKIESTTQSFTTTEDSEKLQIHFEDKKFRLASWNVWVNGVPLFGSKGKALTKQVKFTYDIPLSKGLNKIEVSCVNEVGVESLRSTINIHCEKRQNIVKTYFIGVGASRYVADNFNLEYASKDVYDLEKLFKKGNKNFESHLLIDSAVTKENIRNLKAVLSQATIDDIIIFSYSGHGMLSANSDFYLATHQIDFEHPEALGLNYTELDWLFDSIQCRNKLVFIDACHSGAIDQDLEESVSAELNSSVTESHSRFNEKGAGIQGSTLSIDNSFLLMQELFSNLSDGNGSVVISASGSKEFAFESDKWNNGVFTYCIRKGLQEKLADLNKDDKVTISELQDYISKEVVSLTDGRQRPTSRQENLSNDFVIWD